MIGGAAGAGGAAAAMGAPGMTPRGQVNGPADEAVTGLQAQLTQRASQTMARSAPASATGAQGAPATATPGGQPSGQPNPADGRRSGDQIDRQTMAAVAAALIKGNTENAKALLAANTSMSQAEIDQTLQSLSAQVEKYKADAKAAADAAARYTAAAMWIAFLSSLIALVAAAVGGWLGAGHIHRVHHLRRYEVATPVPR